MIRCTIVHGIERSTTRRGGRFGSAVLLALALGAAAAAAQGREADGARPQAAPLTRHEAVELRASAVEALSASAGDAALERFLDRHVSPALRATMTGEGLMTVLREARRAGAEAGTVNISVTPGGFTIDYRGASASRVVVELEAEAPFRIAALRVEAVEEGPAETIVPITWESLPSRLEEAERDGFSGVVLVVRNDKTVLHRGYGFADRERGRSNTTETLFDIGSIPIDFTKAAILLLDQRGDLSIEDSIAEYIHDVPADKRGITIQHLMSGRSGLPNFHHLPQADEDRDLSWIDRDEAVRRIMAKELLFVPGKGEAHSHSAWGLLAAIVEIASGQSYQRFLQDNFLDPARMTRTCFYGPNRSFRERDYAVGYGVTSVGDPNIPLNWGKTSWLVMGGGGMVSTAGDMDRWVRFVASGKVLEERALDRYRAEGILAGGTDRGFLFAYSQGLAASFYLASNAHEREGDAAWRLMRALAALVEGSGKGH